MSLSKRVRFEVFKRDRFACQYCGKRPPEVMLEVDHIHPVCDGGSDEPSNLTTACFACNRGKSGVSLGELAPAADEMEILAGIQEMLERAITLKRSAAAAEAQRAAEHDAIDVVVRWYVEAFGTDEYIDQSSIRSFLKQTSVSVISDAIAATEAAVDRRNGMTQYRIWKYFCGVCWTMIRNASDGSS